MLGKIRVICFPFIYFFLIYKITSAKSGHKWPKRVYQFINATAPPTDLIDIICLSPMVATGMNVTRHRFD